MRIPFWCSCMVFQHKSRPQERISPLNQHRFRMRKSLSPVPALSMISPFTSKQNEIVSNQSMQLVPLGATCQIDLSRLNLHLKVCCWWVWFDPSIQGSWRNRHIQQVIHVNSIFRASIGHRVSLFSFLVHVDWNSTLQGLFIPVFPHLHLCMPNLAFCCGFTT